jgi:hypothetical protein
LHYLLPELTKVKTEAILRHALGEDVTDEMVEQIHQMTGGNFRSVDMMIPRILELEQRNRQKLAVRIFLQTQSMSEESRPLCPQILVMIQDGLRVAVPH